MSINTLKFNQWPWRGIPIYRYMALNIFLTLKRTPISGVLIHSLFAQEAINLSTNDNATVRDHNCFIPSNLRMPSANSHER